MLMDKDMNVANSVGSGATNEKEKSNLLSRAFRIEWLGQTVASLCWITSVFVYGISSTGDWLQLAAACAWFVANIAALIPQEE